MLSSIRSAEAGMTRAERKVAAHVLAQPEQVLRQPIATVAEAACVSEPTVIRFCRSLGCQGFQDFKLLLAQDLATGAHTGTADPLAEDRAPELIQKVVGGAIGALLKVRDTLPADALAQAVERLAAAERIEFHGLGDSGILASEAQHKFFRLGVPVVAYSDPTIQTMAAALLRPGSALVAISQSGRTQDLLTSAELARGAGAAIIAVTAAGSPLAELADVCLGLEPIDDENAYAPIRTRMAQLVILDSLAVGVALRRSDRTRPG